MDRVDELFEALRDKAMASGEPHMHTKCRALLKHIADLEDRIAALEPLTQGSCDGFSIVHANNRQRSLGYYGRLLKTMSWVEYYWEFAEGATNAFYNDKYWMYCDSPPQDDRARAVARLLGWIK